MAADPAFVRFFEGTFSRALEATDIPGMDNASWDRRAAYLLWLQIDRGRKALVLPDPPAEQEEPQDAGDIFA